MEKRKHYVYVVGATRTVCGNLQSAIKAAVEDMLDWERREIKGIKNEMPSDYDMPKPQLTAPIVSKVFGGYQVVAVGYDGVVRKRRIDVFEPYKQSQGSKRYKVDRAYAMEYKLY